MKNVLMAGWVCVVVANVATVIAEPTPAPGQEFRAVWVTRFEWPSPDVAVCRANIDEVMKTLAAHNFNAVMFQVRGQCDTLYPSPGGEEPWSPFMSPTGTDPGWDPLAYAIEAAHANHLEFHAYINTHVAWQSAEHALPVAPSHIFFKHFNAAAPATCDWLAHNADGNPVQWGEDNYVWIAPGVPEAQAYTRRQILNLVRKYDVDGVHFDRIRTAGAEFSHDPISMARLASEDANPRRLAFDAWTTDQITRFARDLYAQVNEIKPHVKVSSAPVGLVSRDRYLEYPASFNFGVVKGHQDGQAWLAAGAMDFVVPQIYWADNDNKPPDFSRILPDWIEHAAGRHIYPGLSSGVGAMELVHEIQVTRRRGGLGNVMFSYNGVKKRDKFELFSQSSAVYEARVPTPPMPWKSSPNEGIICGTVTDERTGQPIVDAQVRRTGSDDVALSSADGFYSFLKVAPGPCRLSVRKRGWAERQTAEVALAPGWRLVRMDVKVVEAPVTVAAAGNRGTANAGTTTQPVTQQPTVTRGPITTDVGRLRVAKWVVWWVFGTLLAIGAVLVGVAVWVVVGRRRANGRGPDDDQHVEHT